MSNPSEFVLTLSCRDTKGIVYAVSGLLFDAGCNILDSQQYGDVLGQDATGLFFMRVHFEAPVELAQTQALRSLFEPLREKFAMELSLHSLAHTPRLLLMVSKHGHCLNDLLFRCQSGQLRADIVGVVSNHPDFEELCLGHGVPFHHHALVAGACAQDKRDQELKVQALVQDLRIDLVVLARYMQILSGEFCGLALMAPLENIDSKVARIAAAPHTRGPPGCTQLISSSSDQTCINRSRSARCKAS